jgi:hypothetical protein
MVLRYLFPMKPMFESINALCPIYCYSDRERPELIGSGTLLDFGKCRFLITAAHVHDLSRLDEGIRAELYTTGKNEVGKDILVALPPDFVVTSLPASGHRRDDHFDFAILRVIDELADQIARSHFFLPFELTDAEDKLAPSARYMFSGYPVSREKTNYGEKTVAPKRWSLTEHSESVRRITELGLHPDMHVVVRYERDKFADEIGVRKRFPLPKGMSGGPVWRGEGDSRLWLKEAPVKLVGIGIEDREKDRVMVAVRIHLVNYAIAKHYPDVEEYTPLRTGFRY